MRGATSPRDAASLEESADHLEMRHRRADWHYEDWGIDLTRGGDGTSVSALGSARLGSDRIDSARIGSTRIESDRLEADSARRRLGFTSTRLGTDDGSYVSGLSWADYLGQLLVRMLLFRAVAARAS